MAGSGDDKRKLYLHVRNSEYFGNRRNRHEVVKPLYKNGYRNWFIVGDDDGCFSPPSNECSDAGKGQRKILSPIPRMRVEFPRFTINVCIDSTIYVLGGLDFWNSRHDPVNTYSRDLWYFDTADHAADDTSTKSGWMRGPPMMCRRVNPCAVAVDRKIYVFGGIQTPDTQPWAEVFDSQSQKWSEFQLPKSIANMNIRGGVLVDLDMVVDGYNMNKSILLYNPNKRGSLHYYDLKRGKWGLFAANFGSWDSKQLVLSEGTTLFAINKSYTHGYTLCGYDLRCREWFPVEGLDGEQVIPRPEEIDFFPELRIVSLDGGRLCVLWATRLPFRGPLCVRYTEFMVSQVDFVFVAKANPTRFLLLDDAAELNDCLTLGNDVSAGVPRRRVN